MNGYSIKQISKSDCKDFITNRHYLKRMCSVTYAFGLFENDELVGCVTYGVPSSPNIAKSFVHSGFEHLVLELNRLYLLNNKKNEASYLIARSLKMLPKPKIVISYADTAQDHEGIIYRAANFKFLGTTKSKKEWYLTSNPKLHSTTLFGNRTLSELKKIYADDLQQRNRSVKFRFAKVVSNKRYKHYYSLVIKNTPTL